MEYKVCSKCLVEKPMTLYYFSLQQTNKNKFVSECKVCKKKYHAQWREKKRLSQDPDKERMKWELVLTG